MLTLFEEVIPKNEEPIQNVDITTTILYFSTEELKEFKKLAKEAMKKLHPHDFQTKANMPDLILTLLKNYINDN